MAIAYHPLDSDSGIGRCSIPYYVERIGTCGVRQAVQGTLWNVGVIGLVFLKIIGVSVWIVCIRYVVAGDMRKV